MTCDDLPRHERLAQIYQSQKASNDLNKLRTEKILSPSFSSSVSSLTQPVSISNLPEMQPR